MSRRRMLIDCGNTRLKWAMIEDGQWRGHGSCAYADCSMLAAQLSPGCACYVASVASSTHEQKLAALLADAEAAATWLSAAAEFDDVKNTYLNPAQLGVDRWMALIAARQRTRAPVLVVSAGTAMTVDALSGEGVFLGGLIVPGLSMMRRALARETARIAETNGQWRAFPQTTADAVQSGIVAALCGAIQQQHTRLAAAAATPPRCLLTGGDAKTLLPHLAVQAEHAPALVLEGIERVAREST